MDEQELSLLIKERAGLEKASQGRRALGATLVALRCALEDDDARAVSASLPRALGRRFERRSAAVRNADELYAEAERRERVGQGFAREHTQVVLQVLAEQLDDELIARLRRHLPPDIGGLLQPRRLSAAVPPHVHAHPATRAAPPQTLSQARPGTAEPIAEAQHDLAHAASVARSRSPHGESMVETARSTRPGHEDDTLATARERGSR